MVLKFPSRPPERREAKRKRADAYYPILLERTLQRKKKNGRQGGGRGPKAAYVIQGQQGCTVTEVPMALGLRETAFCAR